MLVAHVLAYMREYGPRDVGRPVLAIHNADILYVVLYYIAYVYVSVRFDKSRARGFINDDVEELLCGTGTGQHW